MPSLDAVKVVKHFMTIKTKAFLLVAETGAGKLVRSLLVVLAAFFQTDNALLIIMGYGFQLLAG